MSEDGPAKTTADFNTILKRLEAKNEQLDRELESVLRASKLPRSVLENAQRTLASCDRRIINRAKQTLDTELQALPAPVESHRADRPSVFELASQLGGRLLRV